MFFRVGHRVSSFWASFGASTGKRTSPSTSPQFFALDAAIMRSVRPKIDEKLAVGACTGGGGGGEEPYMTEVFGPWWGGVGEGN